MLQQLQLAQRGAGNGAESEAEPQLVRAGIRIDPVAMILYIEDTVQFVDGGDLSDLVKKNGPLTIERAVDYVIVTNAGDHLFLVVNASMRAQDLAQLALVVRRRRRRPRRRHRPARSARPRFLTLTETTLGRALVVSLRADTTAAARKPALPIRPPDRVLRRGQTRF